MLSYSSTTLYHLFSGHSWYQLFKIDCQENRSWDRGSSAKYLVGTNIYEREKRFRILYRTAPINNNMNHSVFVNLGKLCTEQWPISWGALLQWVPIRAITLAFMTLSYSTRKFVLSRNVMIPVKVSLYSGGRSQITW